MVTVRAPAIEAQLIETFMLLTINHQSLIATKANRIVRAARGRAVLEFGSRRAQGADAAIMGARAAYIGGCRRHGLHHLRPDLRRSRRRHHGPLRGCRCSTRSMRPSRPTAEIYPHNATLLVDTYNTLKSGVPNAIRAFNEVLKPMGITKCGIRTGFRRHRLSDPEGPEDAGRGGLDGVQDLRLQLSGRVPDPAICCCRGPRSTSSAWASG